MSVKGNVVVVSGLLAVSLLFSGNPNADAQIPPARIAIWDTIVPSSSRLSIDDLAKRDTWQQKTRNQKVPAFQGDVVVGNGRVLMVVRKRGSSVEMYSAMTGRPIWRLALRLQTSNGDLATQLVRAALVTHTRSAVRLEVEYQTAQGDSITATFRLRRGDIFLETVPGPGAGRLQINAPGRYVVLPDFFADDIVIDATKIPVPVAEIPSENFLMHLIGEGNAIAMCAFENNDQDVRVTFSGEGTRRVVKSSEIRFGKGRKIWVAIMAAPQIWHELEIKDADAGNIIPLNWKMPFPAQWRVDFTRRSGLVDSWEMLYPAKDGNGYVKPSWLPGGTHNSTPSKTATGEIDVDAYKVGGPASNRLGSDRLRWITYLGRFQYPCWTDTEQKSFVQPLKHRDPEKNQELAFRGPAVIYPINRLPATPIDTFTIVDVVRGTLGVGPCEYILNVEGQHQDHVGRATCHVRRLLNEIYQGKQQKAKQKEIDIYLRDGFDFVTHIRNRISRYVEFGHAMRKYLAAQKIAHPELEETLSEMETIVSQLDKRIDARRGAIKSPEYVAKMNDTFRKTLMGYDGPDSLARLKKYTDALTRIGVNQDELVGECRQIVRTVRQRAALAMAIDPRFAEIAKEIRARTQEVLLKPSAYEGARH